MRKIVVFGGSFNPPTLAHERLLKAAMEGVGADLGVFVPSNDAYVTKKMAKTDWPAEVLPEQTRAAMLRAVCAGDDGLAVDEGEYAYAGTSGNSIDTMNRIRARHPEAEQLYFLFGGDKLKTFTKWKTFREFCEAYRIIVFRRDGFDPEHEIEHTKALREVRDAFVILSAPDGIGGISSTAVRDAVRRGDGETAGSMLRPEVYALLDGSPIRRETAVTSFRGKYAFLSNFYAAEVPFEGMVYPNSEAAFQAAKCLDPEDRIPFTETKNPTVAKRMGRKVALRSDWAYVKLGIMEQIVRAKFAAHPELAERLAATGDLPLAEGNAWHDTFWGVDAKTGKGENHLGEILMKVREECGGGGSVPMPESAVRPVTPVRESVKQAAPRSGEEKPTVPEENRAAAVREEPETVSWPGRILRHPVFGEGRITAVTGEGMSRIVEAEFPSVGTKRLGLAWVEKNCAVTEE